VKFVGWFLGCGAMLALIVCVIGISIVAGGTLYNPGPLSAERTQNRALGGFASHAEFETRCELCHAPFQGAQAARCNACHTNVRDQLSATTGVHGNLQNASNCVACHADHKGRTAQLTRTSLIDFPHNQFRFTLARHQRDYANAPMTCRSCHSFAAQNESANVQRACIDCHGLKDAAFVADHRKQFGDACASCHDGTNNLQGFDHARVFALTGKHAQVKCAQCHPNNKWRGVSRDCAGCHPDPQVHRGQFGTDCAACHTTTAWKPARLIKHTFPLNHGLRRGESACAVCHPINYAMYTCYGCHEHTPAKIEREHQKERARGDIQNCVKCHPTGREHE
jgi:hypothetical protein